MEISKIYKNTLRKKYFQNSRFYDIISIFDVKYRIDNKTK